MSGNILPPQPLLSVTGPLVAGFSQSALRGVLDSSAQTYSQLALKVVQYIQGVLADAANTYQTVAQKVAVPIVVGLNQAQGTVSQIGGQVASQIQAGLNAVTAACSTGCAQEQGAVPGQYKYNVWQDFDVPAVVAFSVGTSSPPSPPANWCFRAGWDDYYDAISYKEKIQGSAPPAGCKLPGGVATSPGTTGPSYTGPNSWMAGCLNGQNVVWDQASQLTPLGVTQVVGPFPSAEQAIAAEPVCAPVPPPPPTGGGAVYAYCPIKDNPAKSPMCAVPPVDTNLWVLADGPYTDMQACQLDLPRIASESPLCQAGPPPPPPPTGPTPCMCVTVPDTLCLKIDLCDWKKFEDHLYSALCRWYKECVCKLNNEIAFSLEDCDQLLSRPVDRWKGKVGAVATDNSVDAIIAMATSAADGTSWGDAGTNPDPWR